MKISNGNFDGNPAIHKNLTIRYLATGTTTPPWDTIDDVFYDDLGTVLYDHQKVIRNGQVRGDRDIPVNTPRGSPDCSGDLWSPRYTYAGIDPVTVPSGTYPDAMKYTVKILDDPLYSKTTTDTYWFANNVPVPVKTTLTDPEKNITYTSELTGWG
jgi:hypothetical protein